MAGAQDLDWKPNALTLEQVQAVLTHHREINIDFVISVFALCLGKKKRIKVESDWRDYWSSSEEVKKDVETFGTDKFIREILHICPNKGSCNYLEAREQMDRRVLETDNYYNGQIQCRVHRTHIKIGK